MKNNWVLSLFLEGTRQSWKKKSDGEFEGRERRLAINKITCIRIMLIQEILQNKPIWQGTEPSEGTGFGAEVNTTPKAKASKPLQFGVNSIAII